MSKLLPVLLLAIVLAGCSSTPTTYSDRDNELSVIDTCQDSVKKMLRDPGSAQFDGWTATPATTFSGRGELKYTPVVNDKLYTASGSVNAKNGFGGYVGARQYGCDAAVSGEHIHAAAYTLDADTTP
jgi:PBP1b-binding outer membrane lipoprotein LpoB